MYVMTGVFVRNDMSVMTSLDTFPATQIPVADPPVNHSIGVGGNSVSQRSVALSTTSLRGPREVSLDLPKGIDDWEMILLVDDARHSNDYLLGEFQKRVDNAVTQRLDVVGVPRAIDSANANPAQHWSIEVNVCLLHRMTSFVFMFCLLH